MTCLELSIVNCCKSYHSFRIVYWDHRVNSRQMGKNREVNIWETTICKMKLQSKIVCALVMLRTKYPCQHQSRKLSPRNLHSHLWQIIASGYSANKHKQGKIWNHINRTMSSQRYKSVKWYADPTQSLTAYIISERLFCTRWTKVVWVCWHVAFGQHVFCQSALHLWYDCLHERQE